MVLETVFYLPLPSLIHPNHLRPLFNIHEAVVKLLLKTGRVDVDFKDLIGRTPL